MSVSFVFLCMHYNDITVVIVGNNDVVVGAVVLCV